MQLKKYSFLIIALVIVVVLGIIYFFEVLPSTEKISEQQKKEILEKTNQQLVWKLSFGVSSKGYPMFTFGKFSKDPRNVKPGETFYTSIRVQDPDGISQVKFTIIGQEETLKKEINLELVEGDEFSGEWQGSLVIPENITHITRVDFYAQNKLGKERSLNLEQ